MTNSTTDDAILDADGADNMESRLLSGLKQNPYITQTDLAKELSLMAVKRIANIRLTIYLRHYK